MFPRDLELELVALFEDHGVSTEVQQKGVRSLLERPRCRRSSSAHSADFPLRFLNFAHVWSERRDDDINIFDVLFLAAAVYIIIKTDPGWAQIPRHTRPLDLRAAIARLFA